VSCKVLCSCCHLFFFGPVLRYGSIRFPAFFFRVLSRPYSMTTFLRIRWEVGFRSLPGLFNGCLITRMLEHTLEPFIYRIVPQAMVDFFSFFPFVIHISLSISLSSYPLCLIRRRSKMLDFIQIFFTCPIQKKQGTTVPTIRSASCQSAICIRHLLGKRSALFDVLLEFRQTGVQQLLLVGRDGTNRMDFFNSVDLFFLSQLSSSLSKKDVGKNVLHLHRARRYSRRTRSLDP
jgi:hypothetical protein